MQPEEPQVGPAPQRGRGTVPESRVLVIATGGTICMKRGPKGYVPEPNFIDLLRIRPSFNDHSNPPPLPCHTDSSKVQATTYLPSLRTPPSAFNRHVRFCVFEFDPLLDSSSINAKGWGQIACAIERNYKLFDAFVVLHGTDSLAYTSSALGFMIRSLGKAIIFTGSQAPITELQNDATDNLLGSLIIAGHFMIPEVCLFFNFKLFRGNRVTKSNAVGFNAFSSPNHPPLATVGINISINWNLITRPSTITPFYVSPYPPGTAHVACLRIFPGILPEMIEGVLKLRGLRGLVLETFGSGNAPEDDRLLEVLRQGVDDGVVVVNVTQCMTGCVSPLYAAGTALAKTGVVLGMDMTSEAALTKLSCLLADPTLSIPEIRSMMSRSLRGEITEQTLTSFSHPPIAAHTLLPQLQPNLGPKQAAHSALCYAIKKGDHAAVASALQAAKATVDSEGAVVSGVGDGLGEEGGRGRGGGGGVGDGVGGGGWILNEFDYTGCTPLHIAATTPNIEILRDFLTQGASVHLRNMDGHTPLYLAADAGLVDNVILLRESGAHLHAEEIDIARLLKGRLEAGSGSVTPIPSNPDIQGGESACSIKMVISRSAGGSPRESGSPSGQGSARLVGDIEERRRRKAKSWELAGA